MPARQPAAQEPTPPIPTTQTWASASIAALFHHINVPYRQTLAPGSLITTDIEPQNK